MNSTLGKFSGHIRLVCSADAQGRSFLSSQSFRAPLHLGKAYWDGEILLVTVVNPTAGLFSGDTIEINVMVAPEAKLLMTTPAASRAHAMPTGTAIVRQKFTVEAGAWLEVWPELLIPQAGCRYEQRTAIDVAPGGGLFFIETLAPGRVARGESFQFSELRWALDIAHGGRPLVRERYRLTPDNDSLQALKEAFPNTYAAGIYLITDRLGPDDGCWEKVRSLHDSDVWVGVSRLARVGWMIKLLARDSVALRRKLDELRLRLSDALPALRSRARKV